MNAEDREAYLMEWELYRRGDGPCPSVPLETIKENDNEEV